MTSNSRDVRFVVVETGASGGYQLAPSDDGAETVVVGQGADEGSAALALRVIRRLTSLQRSGARVQRAVVFLGPAIDERSMAARDLVARAVAYAASTKASELVLATSGSAQSVRDRLLGFVEGLVAEHSLRFPSIRVRFGEIGSD
ncbi:MAG: hypothetical protein ACOY0T_33860 [Myxococcota bacterium]